MPERKELFKLTDFPSCCGAVLAHTFYLGGEYENTAKEKEIVQEIQELRRLNSSSIENSRVTLVTFRKRACMIAITIPKQVEVEAAFKAVGGTLIYSYDNIRMGSGNINNIWAIPLL